MLQSMMMLKSSPCSISCRLPWPTSSMLQENLDSAIEILLWLILERTRQTVSVYEARRRDCGGTDRQTHSNSFRDCGVTLALVSGSRWWHIVCPWRQRSQVAKTVRLCPTQC